MFTRFPPGVHQVLHHARIPGLCFDRAARKRATAATICPLCVGFGAVALEHVVLSLVPQRTLDGHVLKRPHHPVVKATGINIVPFFKTKIMAVTSAGKNGVLTLLYCRFRISI